MDLQVYLILLGAALALVTSFCIELYKDWSINKNLLKNYKIVLKLELKNLIDVFDKLSENYSSKNFFLFRVIDQLDRNLKRLDGTRSDVILLKEEDKKEEILNYLNDLFILSSDLRDLEDYAFKIVENESDEAKKVRSDQRERQITAIKLVDIKRRAQDVIDFLQK